MKIFSFLIFSFIFMRPAPETFILEDAFSQCEHTLSVISLSPILASYVTVRPGNGFMTFKIDAFSFGITALTNSLPVYTTQLSSYTSSPYELYQLPMPPPVLS